MQTIGNHIQNTAGEKYHSPANNHIQNTAGEKYHSPANNHIQNTTGGNYLTTKNRPGSYNDPDYWWFCVATILC